MDYKSINEPATRLKTKDLFYGFSERRSDRDLIAKRLAPNTCNHTIVGLITHKNMRLALEYYACHFDMKNVN